MYGMYGKMGSGGIPSKYRTLSDIPYTGKDISIESCSGMEFPEDLSPYAMVIHCGGCMLNEREVRYRMKCAVDQGGPITNYGILIAHLNGILKRSVEIFPDLAEQIR